MEHTSTKQDEVDPVSKLNVTQERQRIADLLAFLVVRQHRCNASNGDCEDQELRDQTSQPIS